MSYFPLTPAGPPRRAGSVILPRAKIIRDNTFPEYILTFPDTEFEKYKNAITSSGKSNTVILDEFNQKLNDAMTPYAITSTPLVGADVHEDGAEKSELKWNPDPGELAKKILESSSHDYLLRTTIVANYLGMMLDILVEWKNKDTKIGGVLILDILNIFRCIAREFFVGVMIANITEELFEVIKFIIIDYIDFYSKTSTGLNKIILCIQNHLLDNQYFIKLVSELQTYMHDINPEIENPIFILPGHNRASGDDLLGLAAYVTLLKLYPDLIILLTSDGYRDFYSKYIRQGAFSQYFDSYLKRNKSKIQSEINRIKAEIRARASSSYPTRPSSSYPTRPSSYYHTRTGPYGGTKKNKKLLLSKYTRKIAHFKKVKTSHKKHKTTIKAHRKYSKKHRKYSKKHRTYKKQKNS
jgi:hypothetical protein